jgi:integrase/recombinase XerD
MLESYFVRPQTVDRIRALWLGPAIEQYVAWLAERRNAASHVRSCITTLERFDAFARGQGARTWEDLSAHVGAFVEHELQARDAWGRSAKVRRTMLSQARSPVEQLLRLLVPGFVGHTTRRVTPFAVVAPEFFDHLERERGLREQTRRLYAHNLRVFEAYLQRTGVAVADVTPALLTDFLNEPGLRGQALGPMAMQQRGGTLRVFFRYLHRQRVVSADLGCAIPRRRGYRQASLPRAITWSEVERVLAAVERRTPHGKRDYAILLLLATYGLRAREVAALTLDDVDWTRAEIYISARKNGHSTLYPLSAGVADALVDYLKVRPAVPDRQIFLRAMAPFTPLAFHVISSRACHYLRRAAVKPPRAGSHTFRHACVQRLVEANLSFKAIGDYVGHRSAESTQVYGKVAVHLLRQLALGDGEEAL